MKRLVLVLFLIIVAGVAGIVRSHTRSFGISEVPRLLHERSTPATVRDEIRQSYELAPGARVEIDGINGAVKIETSDSKIAELYVERSAVSQEALSRRKITIQNSSGSLTIRGERGDVGVLTRLFGSNPSERISLKLPRQVSLITNGVNGSLIVGDINGSISVHGVNGKVDVGHVGAAEFHGINGSVCVALDELAREGLSLNGINGNVDLRLGEGVNANFETHGMNGRVESDLPNAVIEKKHFGSYSGQIGTGGALISVHGINGNISLTRANRKINRPLIGQAPGAGSKS